MRESLIERQVCLYAESKGILTYKFTSPGCAHVPDRIFVLPGGHTVYVEFKATGEKPRPAQSREIDRLREQGAMVFVIDDIDYGKGMIDGFIN